MIDNAELKALSEMVDAAEELVTGILRPENVERLVDALRAVQPIVWQASARLAGAEAGKAATVLRAARTEAGLWASPAPESLWQSVTCGIGEWMDIDERVRDQIIEAYQSAFNDAAREQRPA